MEEPQWQGSAEEYRTIQGLARNRRYPEAMERAERALIGGQLGRKHAARLHTMLLRVYVEEIHKIGPTAILHGEEAVRLARVVRDAWIQVEAQALLVNACYYLLDGPGAHRHCAPVAAAFEENSQVIVGGISHVLLLQSRAAAAAGEAARRLALLQEAEQAAEAESSSMYARIRLDHIACLLDNGLTAQAQEQFEDLSECAAAALEWEMTRAWLHVEQERFDEAASVLTDVSSIAHQVGNVPVVAVCEALQARIAAGRENETAQRLARLAMHRAVGAGRLDLAHRFRTWLEPLL